MQEHKGKRVLDKGWLAARSTEVHFTGTELTTTDPPDSDQSPWMEAVIPGTVLATLVKNKHVPDPFYGLQNLSIIDIADSGRKHYTFWFFIKFECKLSKNQQADLNFRAINYSAEVYLNGHKKVLPKGMFRRHSIHVTDILNTDGENLLAVLVHPPDHPGRIPSDGGQGGDHEIGQDVTAQYVEGWDWMAPIRDRNTGIWDEVSLCVTGPVKVVDPHLVSSFFDEDTRCYLHTTLGLVNKSDSDAECSLHIQVGHELEDDLFLVDHLQTQSVSVPGKSHVQYTFPEASFYLSPNLQDNHFLLKNPSHKSICFRLARFLSHYLRITTRSVDLNSFGECQPLPRPSELFFYKPDLWWPNGMGKQSLYNVQITVDVQDHGESDSWAQHFGFRKIESHIDKATGGRLFKVNGEHIFIRGGNWILSDGLLRLSKDRYKADIKFHADMNFNMIRCWGGGITERPEFYYYCDIYGLLVWQEFWITGDVDGRGVPISNPNGPLDHDLFLLCARDTVKLLRNHPSLALWVGGNEQVPPDDINDALENDLKLHPSFVNCECKHSTKTLIDPSEYLDGTRLYVKGSLWGGFADGKGDFSDGPYEIQSPENFFRDDFYSYGFNPEVGSVGMPVAATIRATMPPEGWQIPLFEKVGSGYVKEIPNPVWDYHKYIPYSKPSSTHDQILLYGIPSDLDDFCLKAQLANYIQYRALLEGWSSRMWSKYTGVLIWKTQNPWTGLRGQFYDHLHDQTAGFYGCRCAAEPIHVQLNLATSFVEVVNTTAKELSDVAIEVSVWDLDGESPYYNIFDKFTVPPKRTKSTSEMKYPKLKDAKPVYFLLLKLYRKSDSSVLSRNFYWLHLPGGNYEMLEPYRKKKVSLGITSQTVNKGSSQEISIQIENKSKSPASRSLPHNDFFLQRIWKNIGQKVHSLLPKNCSMNTITGTENGVAFFLHLSVHDSKKDLKVGEDTRILPVHYSDNYFSLVPGEVMTVSVEFEVPYGVSPRIMIDGWNIEGGQIAL